MRILYSLLYSLLLVGVTVVWGWTLVVVQDAIALYGVLGFLVVRFVLAAAALAFPPREVWLALGATDLVAWAGAFWVRPSSSSASQRPGRRLS